MESLFRIASWERPVGKAAALSSFVVLLVASFLGLVVSPAFASTASELTKLPTLDSLNRTESPLSNSGKWSALAWDTSKSGHNTGQDTTGGWGPFDSFSTVNGAYWNPSTFSDAGAGEAAQITMQTSPKSENRYVALWLNMGSPGSVKSGYQLSWTENSTLTTYTVKLSKWSSGSQTVLASNSAVSIPDGSTIAISDTGEIVKAWEITHDVHGAPIPVSILSANDSAYGAGYAGVEASGNASRSINFKAGALPGITEVPVLDSFARHDKAENPLATSEWSKSSWSGEIGGVWNDGSRHGYGAGSGTAAAYWNPTSFSDASGGDLVAATVGTGAPSEGEYLAIWLNMPNPSSAKSGYEARFTGVNGSSSNYNVEISKWASGTRTVLASTSKVSLPIDTTIALTDVGGSLTLWSGNSSFLPLLSTTDSTYASGYAGLEVHGLAGSEYKFSAGQFPSVEFLFTGDFDNEHVDLSEWASVQAIPGRITLVKEPVAQGSYAGRFEVQKGDKEPATGSQRAEVISGLEFEESDVRYFRLLTRVDSWDYKHWGIFWQIHDESTGSPPLSLQLYMNKTTPTLWLGAGDESPKYWEAPLPGTGKWFEIVIRVSFGTKGSLKVWLNGNSQTMLNGKTSYDEVDTLGEAPAYDKLGIYRSSEAEQTTVLYEDDYRISEAFFSDPPE